MLRIKSDRMKDLENMKFKYDSFGFYIYKIDLPFGESRLIIDEDTGYISISGGDSILTILFDLIKADMVEKVVKNGSSN